MTVDNVENVIDSVASVVTNLDEADEQTMENLGVIVGVFAQIGALIGNSGFNVTDDVSIGNVMYVCNTGFTECMYVVCRECRKCVK